MLTGESKADANRGFARPLPDDVNDGLVPDLRKIGLHPDFWYPVAVAKHLKKGKSLGVSFAGEPIVLVRTESNKIYALEDRCAHRQMPLRYGVVTGERLRCCYHAWSYDEHGRCQVPYLPEGVPAPRGVRAYPCRVAHNLVFIFPGDPALAEIAPLPELAAFQSRKYVTISFVRQVNCHYSFMHENLMDMNHQFLHRRWMGRLRPALLDVRQLNGRVEADYRFDFLKRRLDLRNLLQALVGVRVADRPSPGAPSTVADEERPKYGNDFMTVSTQYPYQTLELRRPNVPEPILCLWVAYVSVDREQRINRPCGVLMIRKPMIPWLAYVMRPLFRYFTDSIFEEDRFALEAEQQAHDLQGADWNQEILPLIVNLRKFLISSGIPIRN